MYSQDWRENITQIQLDDTTILALNIDLECERAERMRKLLLRHGRRFDSMPFNPRYQHASLQDRCYDAAVVLAKACGLVYVEGVVFIEIGGRTIPYCHGWCAEKDGTIVDPTMWKHQHKESLQYVGVPIKLDYVEEQYKQTGYYGLLDGRHDGAKKGIHYDDVSKWKDTTLEEFKIESIIGPT